jgi:hypothetical protein
MQAAADVVREVSLGRVVQIETHHHADGEAKHQNSRREPETLLERHGCDLPRIVRNELETRRHSIFAFANHIMRRRAA